MTLTFPPLLPPGRVVTLPGRGNTFVREVPGPSGAPTVLLLHGWIATADLNWWTAYTALGRSFRVIAMDQRGHGRGIANTRPFSLEECAGDAAALIEQLGAGPAIVVGYSMGGPVAQLTWRDHPRSVRGLVLCATSASFPAGTRERALYTAAAYGMALAPGSLRHRMMGYFLARAGRNDAYRDWLIGEIAPHRMSAIVQAGRELGRFDSTPWIGAVDVPTACLVCTRDDVVPPARQYALRGAIPGASLHELEADHLACARRADIFVPALVAACREVVAGRAAPSQGVA